MHQRCSGWCSFFSHWRTPVTRRSLLQGVIQHATINNLAFGRNIEETQRVLQALKYVQVSEGCQELSMSVCMQHLHAAMVSGSTCLVWLCRCILTSECNIDDSKQSSQVTALLI
jgi:uncharacterized protein (UPF0212 family)